MGEGLEFNVEVDAEAQDVIKLARSLDELVATMKQADSGTRKVEESTKHAGEGHKRQGHEAEKLGGILHRLVHTGMEPFIERAERIAEFEFIRRGVDALLEAPGELIEKVKELGAEILSAGAKAERTEAAFGNLFGEEGGKEQIEIIDEIGQHTEFTRENLKDMTLDLAQAGGFQGEALIRARAAVLDIASFSKNAEEGASRAASALGRINLSGHVDARSLRGVGISEKTYFGALSERTGKDAKSLKKEMEAGTLDTSEALEALYTVITRKTNKLLGGAGADMEKTFSARLKHVKELPDLIFESVKDSRGFSEIGDFLGEVAAKLGPESEFGIAAKQGIAAVFDELGDGLKNIDLDETLSEALDVLRQMPDAVHAVSETVQDLYEGLKPVVEMIGAIAYPLLELYSVVDHKRTGKEIADDAAERTPAVFEQRRKLREQLALKRQADRYGEPFDQDASTRLPKVGEELGNGLAKGMAKSADVIGEAASGMGDHAEKGLRDRTQTHSPSRVFEDIGYDVADGFNLGIQRAGRSPALEDMVSLPPGRGGGGSAGVVVNLGGIHVSVPGGDSAHIVDTIADKIDEMLPGRLQSMFERVGAQAGAS